jgi:hypothetical protein
VRKIREVLRLKAEGFSDRQIAAAIGSARSTVQECVRRAREAGLIWPLPPTMDEAALHARMYRRVVPLSRTPRPDFAYLHEELRRRGVTRLLLWEEYKAAHPDGWQYSVFCDQYRRWLATQELVLRQEHAPGEKLFVDYAGQTVEITDRPCPHGPTLSPDAALLMSRCSCNSRAHLNFAQRRLKVPTLPRAQKPIELVLLDHIGAEYFTQRAPRGADQALFKQTLLGGAGDDLAARARAV